MDRITPVDLPDEPANVVPVFTSRRNAEKLPSLRPDTGPRLKLLQLRLVAALVVSVLK